ncbi:S1-like domain-containing RNA-binding protein [uncultured Pseudoteredinibacter sp.]|uniref:CvfB family protein n=1 Tax=uncultured Pseudoteredinibacter sp. TaxID=1641701 RepID=UPI0026089AD2|nr:S1-like domain-containing RNA-binding protein [uncultured Pseudoteredinibacter sp.]
MKTPKMGRYAQLNVVDFHPAGALLEGGKLGRILLPSRQVPSDIEINDSIRVFIYRDSEDRVIATTQRPKVQLNQVANLKVLDVNSTGAFLDWGLSKDLFLPYSNQSNKVVAGQHILIYVYLDNEDRLTATTLLDRHLKDFSSDYKLGEKVRLTIANRSDLGQKVIVDHQYWGLIHKDNMRQSLKIGQRIDGYIRQLRDDKRLDISLEQPGYKKVGGLSDQILERLQNAGGYIALADKSPAELIEAEFGVSKRVYKMAIGKLYKNRIITIESDGIRLIDS